MSELSVEQLGKAIARLEESVAASAAESANLMFRDSVLLRFDFVFEVMQCVLRKFLVSYSVNLKGRDQFSYAALIRTASQDGLLRESYEVWHSFKDARNSSSHAYIDEQAVAVVAIVSGFLEEVKFLHQRLLEQIPV